MKYLLDTCVVSELVAKRPGPHVLAWVDSLDPNDVFLSAITIGEISRGIAKLPASARKEALERWLQDDLLTRFEGRIAPIDRDVMLAWGKLSVRQERAGRPMSAMDSLIAALVWHGRYVLATRNTADFDQSGIQLINPWMLDEESHDD